MNGDSPNLTPPRSPLDDDVRIKRLLDTVVGDLRRFAEDQITELDDLVDIAVSMTAQKETGVVLEMILSHARKITNSDGGTLYLMSDDRKELEFHVVHNESLDMFQGGTSGQEVKIPPVQMYTDDGEINHTNVSAHVAHTGELENIPDVYYAEGFDFSGAKRFDEALKYRSKSMLTMPMVDHNNETIGVLQLINAIDPESEEVIPFDTHHVRRVSALASLAAVELTQQALIRDMKQLFDSFIQALATSIDAMSKHTGNHISRVTELTVMIADAVQNIGEGPLAPVRFTPEEMEELEVAAWLHDTGKITTPMHVVNKSTRLEKVGDRIEIITARFEARKEQARVKALEKLLGAADGHISAELRQQVEQELETELASLNDELHFLHVMNNGDLFMEGDKLDRLHQIAGITWEEKGEEKPILTPEEVEDLSIKRGTLNDEERKIIQNHVVASERILNEIHWPRTMPNVAKIAADHHEKMNGHGYPKGLPAEEIFLQSRIMAVADVFEALSAKDRPYKAPMKLSKAIQILGFMVKDGELDGDVVDVCLKTGVLFDYAEKRLAPDQIDVTREEFMEAKAKG